MEEQDTCACPQEENQKRQINARPKVFETVIGSYLHRITGMRYNMTLLNLNFSVSVIRELNQSVSSSRTFVTPYINQETHT